jgi:hypothetical protein
MSDIKRRLNRLEGASRPEPQDEEEREKKRQDIREQAEHANYCAGGAKSSADGPSLR